MSTPAERLTQVLADDTTAKVSPAKRNPVGTDTMLMRFAKAPGLKAELEKLAHANRRSLNAEILVRLEESVRRP